MKYTKGPWRLCNDGDCSCLQISGEHHPIAKVISGKWGDEYPSLRFTEGNAGSINPKIEVYMEQITYGTLSEEMAKANARLMVKAPQLLEALEDLVDCLESNPSYIPEGIDNAKKIILETKE